jgi:ketosteroid isomerase-like protein
MTTRLAILGAAALALTACAPKADTHADTDAATKAVLADAHAVIAAFNAHDGAKAVSHDAPNILAMNHGAANAYGPQGDLANLQPLLAPAAKAHLDVGAESVEMAASGDMAVYRADYVLSRADPNTGRPVAERGNWLMGYKLISGTWKIVWSVTSDTGA